jgi:hypothetical protein
MIRVIKCAEEFGSVLVRTIQRDSDARPGEL